MLLGDAARRLSLTDAEIEALPGGGGPPLGLRASSATGSASRAPGRSSPRSSCTWSPSSGSTIDIVELDTHLFFRETYETRERLVERYGLNLIRPEIITIAEQHEQEGPNLWEHEPDRCCHIRKVEPLIQALRALRRLDLGHPARAVAVAGGREEGRALRAATASGRSSRSRTGPRRTSGATSSQNDIPYNPLHDVGYRSIGCIPCTRPTRPDEEERAGRWAGSDKLECGIHVENKDT